MEIVYFTPVFHLFLFFDRFQHFAVAIAKEEIKELLGHTVATTHSMRAFNIQIQLTACRVSALNIDAKPIFTKKSLKEITDKSTESHFRVWRGVTHEPEMESKTMAIGDTEQ